MLTSSTEAVDKSFGNREGWSTSFDFKTPERGVATHVYAAFAPELKGTSDGVDVIREVLV